MSEYVLYGYASENSTSIREDRRGLTILSELKDKWKLDIVIYDINTLRLLTRQEIIHEYSYSASKLLTLELLRQVDLLLETRYAI